MYNCGGEPERFPRRRRERSKTGEGRTGAFAVTARGAAAATAVCGGALGFGVGMPLALGIQLLEPLGVKVLKPGLGYVLRLVSARRLLAFARRRAERALLLGLRARRRPQAALSGELRACWVVECHERSFPRSHGPHTSSLTPASSARYNVTVQWAGLDNLRLLMQEQSAGLGRQ